MVVDGTNVSPQSSMVSPRLGVFPWGIVCARCDSTLGVSFVNDVFPPSGRGTLCQSWIESDYGSNVEWDGIECEPFDFSISRNY